MRRALATTAALGACSALAAATPAHATSTDGATGAARSIYFSGGNGYGIGKVSASGGMVTKLMGGPRVVYLAVDTSGNSYPTFDSVLGHETTLYKVSAGGRTSAPSLRT